MAVEVEVFEDGSPAYVQTFQVMPRSGEFIRSNDALYRIDFVIHEVRQSGLISATVQVSRAENNDLLG